MKSLRESLLDDIDVVSDKLGVRALIEEWLKKYNIKNYKINKDNTIDADMDVSLFQYPESELPSYIQFRKVVGRFSVSDSELKTLKGSPNGICGYFDCSGCTHLTSLEGAPRETVKAFDCSNCNSLTSLKGAPKKVGGSFYCNKCTSLTSLEGAPKKVGGSFYCRECTSLTSLEGAPKKVGGNFACPDCSSLTSLKGAPKEVEWNFYCIRCEKLNVTKEDIEKICKVAGIINI